MHESDGVLHARQQLAANVDYIERLERSLQDEGLSADEAQRALQPALAFHAQLQEELAQLECTVEPGADEGAPSQTG